MVVSHKEYCHESSARWLRDASRSHLLAHRCYQPPP